MKIWKIALISVLPLGIVYFFVDSYMEESEFKKGNFSKNYSVQKKIFSFDTDRDFHGDGFSIDIEEMDNGSKLYFRNPPKEFFIKYPLKSRNNFEIQTWRRTPISADDSLCLPFALPMDTASLDRNGLQEADVTIFKQANKILNSPGSYYAICYRGALAVNITGIDLYVIDPQKGLIYTINRQ